MALSDEGSGAMMTPAMLADDRPEPTWRTIVLTDDQIASFHREGFLSLPSITTAQEIEWLRCVYHKLFETRAGWKDGNYLDFASHDDALVRIPQILMPSIYEPALRETQIYRNCFGIAKQLLGPSAEFVFDHAMTKPANGGPPTPWHQDKAFYTRKTTHETITFWMPLQPVTRESGCLRFIAKSNHGPLLEHRHLNDDPRIHGLEALNVDEANRVYCPLDSGGVTIFHHRTLHGADANIGDKPRWAYAMGFGVKAALPMIMHEFAGR